MKLLISATTLIAALLVTGCNKEQAASVPPPKTPEKVELPASLALSAPPEDVVYLTSASDTVKAGDTIHLAAIVDESGVPFNKTYAAFTVANKSGEKACCPSCLGADIKKATVQVLDSDGNVIKKTLEGFQGLAPGAKVSVVGVVSPDFVSGGSLVINASGLYVHKE